MGKIQSYFQLQYLLHLNPYNIKITIIEFIGILAQSLILPLPYNLETISAFTGPPTS